VFVLRLISPHALAHAAQRKEDLELRQMLSKRQEFELKMDSLQRLR
jgi:hypothetical protein